MKKLNSNLGNKNTISDIMASCNCFASCSCNNSGNFVRSKESWYAISKSTSFSRKPEPY